MGIFQKAFRGILLKEHGFRAACGMIPNLETVSWNFESLCDFFVGEA